MNVKHLATGAVALSLVALGAAGCGGSAPAAAPAAPAAAAAPAAPQFKDLIVTVDTGESGANVAPADKESKDCVMKNRFLHNEGIFWRIRVTDPVTGKDMTDKELSKVEVKLADGTPVTMNYKGRPSKAPTDTFWQGAWTIPETYPSGALNFTVNVTANDGRTNNGKTTAFNVANTNLVVLDGKVPDIGTK